MNYVKIRNTNDKSEKYFYNPTIGEFDNNRKLTQLHIYRIREFIELLANMSDIELTQKTKDEILALSISLLKYKEKINVTINEITLASIWVVIKEKGLSNLSLIKMIEISRKKLRKKILRRNILKILSLIRQKSNSFNPRPEIIKHGSFIIKKLMNNQDIKKRLKSVQNEELEKQYFVLLKKEFLKIILKIPIHRFSGKSRITMAAILVYLADKIVSMKMNVRPIISAKLLEDLTGTCQFTILRNYKKYLPSL